MRTISFAALPALVPLALLPILPAQAVWFQVPTSTAPSPRRDAAIAHDSLRDRIVLFGGTTTTAALTDTWEHNGSTWQQRATTVHPDGGWVTMAYDRGRQRIMMVTNNSTRTRTWEYDGNDWSLLATAHHPQGNGTDRMVYDSGRGCLVYVVAGSASNGGGQTWEFNGFDWIQRTVASAPAVYQAGLVFDPLRNRTILHGGYVASGATTGATWEYDGNAWTQSNGPAHPVRESFAFTFDWGRRRAVLFGGLGPSGPGTWEYTATGWILRTQAGPPDRSGGAMAYDQIRNECVLFGGASGSQQFGDTWRYRVLAPAIANQFGQGCGGSGAPPGLLPQPYQLPYLGTTFGLSLYSLPANQLSFVAFGWSRTSAGAFSLPLPLQSFGMPGCQLLVSPDVTLPTLASANRATAAIQVPAQANLAGLQFFLQAFALDLGGNAAGLVNSPALTCRVGDP